MPVDQRIIRFIRRNVRFFSALVFASSALLLLIAFSQEKHFLAEPNKTDVEPWLKVIEETLKGILAASAVAFLYDWILKLETTTEMADIIHHEIEAVKYISRGASFDTLIDHSIEFIFTPLEGMSLGERQNGFCRMSVHCKYVTGYHGDEVKLVLLTPSENNNELNIDSSCIFYWELDASPSDTIDKQWLDITSLRIDKEPWLEHQRYIEGNALVVKFRKPRNVRPRRSKFVTYEFDLRTIEDNVPLQKTYFINHRMVNPTFRIDARQLKAKSIRSIFPSRSTNILQGQYVRAPEGNGTCQIFVNDSIEPGGAVTFTIVK